MMGGMTHLMQHWFCKKYGVGDYLQTARAIRSLEKSKGSWKSRYELNACKIPFWSQQRGKEEEHTELLNFRLSLNYTLEELLTA